MNIYPAIDLRHGKVVRLKYGDPNQQTTYSDDPIETARRWAEAGAQWIHVVNLDGAFGDEAGAAINRSLLQSLTAVGPKIQFGGGLRSIGRYRSGVVTRRGARGDRHAGDRAARRAARSRRAVWIRSGGGGSRCAAAAA